MSGDLNNKMTEIHAWASHGPKQRLEPFSFNFGPLGPEEVEIAIEHCGLCHSDLSIINDEWGISKFPVVPGHEVVGHIVAKGRLCERPTDWPAGRRGLEFRELHALPRMPGRRQ